MSFTPVSVLLAKSGLITLPSGLDTHLKCGGADVTARADLGTVLANMTYYGFAPSKSLMAVLARTTEEGLKMFWEHQEPLLMNITGEDRNMGEFMVYKNFPKEVLDMSQAQYWTHQILMYIGLPNAIFTQEVKDRAPMSETVSLKVLDIAPDDALETLAANLLASSASWNDDQNEAAMELFDQSVINTIDMGAFGYRLNGAMLAVRALRKGQFDLVSTTSATDVLRIVAGLCGNDMELKTKPRFGNFARSYRRSILATLDQCANLEEDFARHGEIWKRLLSRLHPGDYKFANVNHAYRDLYMGSRDRLNARLESSFNKQSHTALDILKKEPGLFMRSLHRAYGIFGAAAFTAFEDVLDELSVAQLLKISSYLKKATGEFVQKPIPGAINGALAEQLVKIAGAEAAATSKSVVASKTLVRPKGNWSKAVVVKRFKSPIDEADRTSMIKLIQRTIGARIDAIYPQGVNLDPKLAQVKLATNGQELASYGRGTEFDIPENAKFVRSASFWAQSSYGNTWFDNGWNFLDASFKPVATCSWDNERVVIDGNTPAIFSGDPTNSKDLEGRGCQMIDIYLDELEDAGIAYATWNILCYSGVTFSDAEDVLATLQWGEDAEEGKVYEPSRAQMVFPLKGDNLTKYVAYIDVARRKLVYMDADLPALVSSAGRNSEFLTEQMPAFMEYTDQQPSVADLFANAKVGSLPVVYNDDTLSIDGDAFVFQPTNTQNRIDKIDLEPLLALTGADVERIEKEAREKAA